MKFIHSIQGAAALHVAVDEVLPPKGIIQEELIRVIGEGYKFSVRPSIPKNIPPDLLMPYVFQTGSVTFDDGKFPVYQIIVLQHGDIIVSATTEIADRVLADYMNRLDTELGYRFNEGKTKRITHQSHVVVDFEANVGKLLAPLGKVESLLNKELPRAGAPFVFRRLSFGSGPVLPAGTITLEAFEGMDFIIERRTAEIEVPNRYYSAAPISTSEHIRLLEAIERELMG